MIFRRDDFVVESWGELLSYCLVAPFVGLIAPFLLAAYGLGFVMDLTGWLDT